MATKFGMALPAGEVYVPLALRVPQFAKTGDEIEDSIRTSRRGQMQEMITGMIIDPDRHIPALYGHFSKVKPLNSGTSSETNNCSKSTRS